MIFLGSWRWAPWQVFERKEPQFTGAKRVTGLKVLGGRTSAEGGFSSHHVVLGLGSNSKAQEWGYSKQTPVPFFWLLDYSNTDPQGTGISPGIPCWEKEKAEHYHQMRNLAEP